MSSFGPIDDDDTYQLETPVPPPRPVPQRAELNPYAAPAYVNEGRVPHAPHLGVVPTPVSFGEVYRETWRTFFPHCWSCIGGMALCTALMLTIMIGFQAAMLFLMVDLRPLEDVPVTTTVEEEEADWDSEYFFLMQNDTSSERFIAPEWIGSEVEEKRIPVPSGQPSPVQLLLVGVGMMISVVLYIIVPFWLIAGLTQFFMQIARHGEAKFSLLFSGGSVLLQLIVYYLLTAVAAMAVALVVGVPCAVLTFALRTPMLLMGALVMIYIAILLLMAYTLPGFWLVIARKLDAINALTKTLSIARINMGSMFLLFLWNTLLMLPASILIFAAVHFLEMQAFGAAAACFLGYFLLVTLVGAYAFMCGNVFCMLASGEEMPGNEAF